MSSDRFAPACPFCGGTEMIEAHDGGYGVVGISCSVPLNYTICRRCGSIVRRYVADPEKLLKKKDRRKTDD